MGVRSEVTLGTLGLELSAVWDGNSLELKSLSLLVHVTSGAPLSFRLCVSVGGGGDCWDCQVHVWFGGGEVGGRVGSRGPERISELEASNSSE